MPVAGCDENKKDIRKIWRNYVVNITQKFGEKESEKETKKVVFSVELNRR